MNLTYKFFDIHAGYFYLDIDYINAHPFDELVVRMDDIPFLTINKKTFINYPFKLFKFRVNDIKLDIYIKYNNKYVLLNLNDSFSEDSTSILDHAPSINIIKNFCLLNLFNGQILESSVDKLFKNLLLSTNNVNLSNLILINNAGIMEYRIVDFLLIFSNTMKIDIVENNYIIIRYNENDIFSNFCVDYIINNSPLNLDNNSEIFFSKISSYPGITTINFNEKIFVGITKNKINWSGQSIFKNKKLMLTFPKF